MNLEEKIKKLEEFHPELAREAIELLKPYTLEQQGSILYEITQLISRQEYTSEAIQSALNTLQKLTSTILILTNTNAPILYDITELAYHTDKETTEQVLQFITQYVPEQQKEILSGIVQIARCADTKTTQQTLELLTHYTPEQQKMLLPQIGIFSIQGSTEKTQQKLSILAETTPAIKVILQEKTPEQQQKILEGITQIVRYADKKIIQQTLQLIPKYTPDQQYTILNEIILEANNGPAFESIPNIITALTTLTPQIIAALTAQIQAIQKIYIRKNTVISIYTEIQQQALLESIVRAACLGTEITQTTVETLTTLTPQIQKQLTNTTVGDQHKRIHIITKIARHGTETTQQALQLIAPYGQEQKQIILDNIGIIANRSDAKTTQQTLQLIKKYKTPEQQTTILSGIITIARNTSTVTMQRTLETLTTLTPQIQTLLTQYETPEQQQTLLEQITNIASYGMETTQKTLELLAPYTPKQQKTILDKITNKAFFGTKAAQKIINVLIQYDNPLQAIDFINQYPKLTRPYTPKTQETIQETIKFIQALKPEQAQQNTKAFQEQLNKIPDENYEINTRRYCYRLLRDLKDNADRLERITI